MPFRATAFVIAVLALPACASAQGAHLRLPDFGSLEAQATESVNVSLSPTLLHIASHFMKDGDTSDQQLQKVLAKVESIQVRSFQFATDNAYSQSDIESVRQQLSAPGWTRIVQTRDQKHQDNVDVYLRTEGDKTTGLAVVVSEAREFTIVNIVGAIDMADLARLGGQMGIPKLGAT